MGPFVAKAIRGHSDAWNRKAWNGKAGLGAARCPLGAERERMARVINGRPYEPQVKMLMERYGNMPRGSVIGSADIAQVIGEEEGSCRYWAVRGRWRARMLQDRGLACVTVSGEGVRLIDSADEQMRRVPLAHLKRAAKEMRASVNAAEWTRDAELTPEMQKARMHFLTRVKPMVGMMAEERRALVPELAPVRPKA